MSRAVFWNSEMDRKLVSLWQARTAPAEIAKLIGTSTAAVITRASVLRKILPAGTLVQRAAGQTRTDARITRMLDYIKREGFVLRRDLREGIHITSKEITAHLAPHIASGLIGEERAVDPLHNRMATYYRWLGDNPIVLKKGQCLGGCGTDIVRDGRIFMCAPCRSAAASVSPYAA